MTAAVVLQSRSMTLESVYVSVFASLYVFVCVCPRASVPFMCVFLSQHVVYMLACLCDAVISLLQ